MKPTIIMLLLGAVIATAPAQNRKAQEYLERRAAVQAPLGIGDRAGGTHNRSNIGLFFENRGKLYPRRSEQGPSGRWPITSDPPHEYIYRINPFVAVPGNVVQGRFTSNEEWEAAAGYNNTDSARIAFSDRPSTWPPTGWPVRDADGNPVVVSDQDSYCVYNDSTNSRSRLLLQVNQTGYTFSLKPIQDLIIYKFEIVNKAAVEYDSLFFGLYLDIDIGEGGSGQEYLDDKILLDRARNLVYYYDADGFSPDWGGAPGLFGAMMIQTPEVGGIQPGLTDFHYMDYDDELDRDTVQYGILSSAPSLYAAPLGRRYFHLGANAPNLHFDDPATIPPGGGDLTSFAGSGPYTIGPGDTLTFVTAIVAGNTSAELLATADRARNLVALGYVRPQPPQPPPTVTVVPGDKRVTIYWNTLAETSLDPISGHVFEGYKLYKSIDLGQHWDQIDRNQFPAVGPDPVPLAVYDRVNGIAPDNGLQYSYVDSMVTNGFEYWYSVTAYDKADSLLESLENARGNDAEAQNLGIAVPRSSAIGRTPVSATTTQQIGTGGSNVIFSLYPTDTPEAADRTYEVRFAPVSSIQEGNLRTVVDVAVDSSGPATAHDFGVAFLSASEFRVTDLRLDTLVVPSAPYRSDSSYAFAGLQVTMRDTAFSSDFRPQTGDSLVIRFGLRVATGGAEVLPLHPVVDGALYATTNGVIFTVTPVEPVQEIRRISGTGPVTVTASVFQPSAVVDNLYSLRIDNLFADSSRTVFRATVSVRDNADSLVAGRDSLLPGGAVILPGFALSVVFDSTTTIGTVVQIRTVQQNPLTYKDAFSFATVGARVDQAKVASELSRVKVVPNPYLVSSLYEREYGALRREPIRQLKFINLPPQCTIDIFTLAGDQVQTLVHDSQDGTHTWDLRGAGERVIAPGIYLYLVRTGSDERLGRFAVIK